LFDCFEVFKEVTGGEPKKQSPPNVNDSPPRHTPPPPRPIITTPSFDLDCANVTLLSLE